MTLLSSLGHLIPRGPDCTAALYYLRDCQARTALAFVPFLWLCCTDHTLFTHSLSFLHNRLLICRLFCLVSNGVTYKPIIPDFSLHSHLFIASWQILNMCGVGVTRSKHYKDIIVVVNTELIQRNYFIHGRLFWHLFNI